MLVKSQIKQGSVLNAALFIAATSIGISYFTLPILTGIAGFLPAVLMTVVVRLFTLAISLLYAEAILGQPDGANLISISRALMGKTWMVILGLMFFLNMASFLTIYAYFAENFLHWFFTDVFHLTLHPIVGGLLSTVPFFFIVFLGITASFRANALMMVGLIISFGFTVYLGSDQIVIGHLFQNQWVYIFFCVPTLFGALGFMSIMPPICSYLNRDPKKIRQSTWLGAMITLVVYLIWEWFVIGAVPAGTLWAYYEEGADLQRFATLIARFPKIVYFFNFTLLFSMVTSMVGYGLALTEFLADGFKIPPEQRRGWKRLAICFGILILILPISLTNGDLFPRLMQRYIAPLAEILVNGIIPVWMVATMRYLHNIPAPYMLPGGRASLIALGIGLFFLIYFEGIMLIAS